MTSRKISDYKWHLITDKDNIKHITDTDCFGKMKHQIPMIGLFWSKTVQME